MRTIINSLMSIGSVLSRSEMRRIMAGDNHCQSGWQSCIEEAQNPEERRQCVDAWCACIQCPNCECEC